MMAETNNEKMQELLKENNGEFPYYTDLGGYPLFYLCADGGVLCPKCANENKDLTNDPDDPQWFIIAYDINYEDETMYCDHCNDHIVSAYGDDE